MRARRPRATEPTAATCPRCAALLPAGEGACRLCGWEAGRLGVEPSSASSLSLGDPQPDPPGSWADAPALDPVALEQLEALDELSDPTTGPSAVDTRTGAAARERHADVASTGSTTVMLLDAERRETVVEAAEPVGPSLGLDPAPLTAPEGAAPPGVRLRGPSRSVVALAWTVGSLALVRTGLGSGTDAGVLPPAAGELVEPLGWALAVAIVLLAVTFLGWIARTRRVVAKRSPARQRWSPRTAVAGWLVPVVGLFVGWQVLQDLWLASDPETREQADARAPEPLLLTGWLAGLAVSSVIWLVGEVLLGGSPLVDIAAAAAFTASLACLARTVTRISRWQDEWSLPG